MTDKIYYISVAYSDFYTPLIRKVIADNPSEAMAKAIKYEIEHGKENVSEIKFVSYYQADIVIIE